MAFYKYLIQNKEGICLTEEGLDLLWPLHGESTLTQDGKLPFKIPPTCLPGTPTFEDQVGSEKLYGFVFSGSKTHHTTPDLPAVPLPEPIGFMIGIVCIFLLLSLWRNCEDFETIR